MPSISSNWGNRTRSLRRSFSLVFVLGGATCLVFWLFHSLVVTILVGSRYEPYSYLLPKLSLAIFLISLSNLLFYYLLSIRHIVSLFISFAGLLIFIIMSTAHHSTLEEIINNLLAASSITLAALFLILSVWPRLRRFADHGIIYDLRDSTDE